MGGINDFHIEEPQQVEENNASTLITDAINSQLQELIPTIVSAVTQQLQPNGEKEPKRQKSTSIKKRKRRNVVEEVKESSSSSSDSFDDSSNSSTETMSTNNIVNESLHKKKKRRKKTGGIITCTFGTKHQSVRIRVLSLIGQFLIRNLCMRHLRIMPAQITVSGAIPHIICHHVVHLIYVNHNQQLLLSIKHQLDHTTLSLSLIRINRFHNIAPEADWLSTQLNETARKLSQL